MSRLWTWLKSLAPLAQGFVGALLCAGLLGSGWWVSQRYAEFVVMRGVISQIIEQSNKQAAQQQKPAPKAEAQK